MFGGVINLVKVMLMPVLILVLTVSCATNKLFVKGFRLISLN